MRPRQNNDGDFIVPYVPPELVDFLEGVYPDRVPDISISDREFGAKYGQREVINYLKQLVQNQEEDMKDYVY